MAVCKTSGALITPIKSGLQGDPSTVSKDKVAAVLFIRVTVPITYRTVGRSARSEMGREDRKGKRHTIELGSGIDSASSFPLTDITYQQNQNRQYFFLPNSHGCKQTYSSLSNNFP